MNKRQAVKLIRNMATWAEKGGGSCPASVGQLYALAESVGAHWRDVSPAETVKLKAESIAKYGPMDGAPFGYFRDPDNGAFFVADPEEQAAIPRVIDAFQAAGSLRGAAARLAADGVPYRGGGVWHFERVRSILKAAGLYPASAT